MKNSIFYSDDIFYLDFFQTIYWKNMYFFLFARKKIISIFRFRFVFFNFFNFFWIFKIFHNRTRVFNLFFTNDYLNYFIEENTLLDSTDSDLTLILLDYYCNVIIRSLFIRTFRKRNKAFTAISQKKFNSYMEFFPGLLLRRVSLMRSTSVDFFLRHHSIRKKKLRYYRRLTRKLKSNIHT